MQSIQDLNAVSDDELLHRLAALLDDSRHTEADLVAHIAEVDARRLYAREATPSMFQYCTERLHLSGAEAYLRIAAGRAAREHPIILGMLAEGRLHLTAIAMLAPHLTPQNRDVLLARATHKTKREIEDMIAEVAPRPDAPALIRKLPERRTTCLLASTRSATPPSAVSLTAAVPASGPSESVQSGTLPASVPSCDVPSETSGSGPELRLDGVLSNRLGEVVARSDRVAARSATMEALSPARYKVQFTASAELRDKLERLQALMRSSVRDGDLAAIIEDAVSEKLERLEARRFARTRRPRKTLSDTDTSPRTRHVPAAVKRAVHDREKERCRYVDEQGRRCTAQVSLQLHHRHTFAMGGDHSTDNLSLLCHAHNRYLAEIDYGRKAMAGHERQDGPDRRASDGS